MFANGGADEYNLLLTRYHAINNNDHAAVKPAKNMAVTTPNAYVMLASEIIRVHHLRRFQVLSPA